MAKRRKKKTQTVATALKGAILRVKVLDGAGGARIISGIVGPPVKRRPRPKKGGGRRKKRPARKKA